MAHKLTSYPPADARNIILPDDLEHKLKTARKGARRSIASRLGLFADWLDATGRDWTTPDLAQYRDHLLDKGRSPATVNVHLSTIRSRYRDLLSDNAVIARLDQRAAEVCEQYGWEPNPANLGAMVERVRGQIANGTASHRTRAREKTVQDRAASDFTRLTTGQANRLLAAPGTDTLMGLRDTAILALALTTGARAAEIAALSVGDHRQRTEDNALALLIRDGKGDKQRLVPYGALDFAPAIVDAWLSHAGIAAGPIFRGFYKGGRRVRSGAISVVAIEHLLARYPVTLDGAARVIKPHDLRRTYARLAYESGMKPVAIQQNLGHASLETTLGYIGDLDTQQRQPGAFLRFDLRALEGDPLV